MNAIEAILGTQVIHPTLTFFFFIYLHNLLKPIIGVNMYQLENYLMRI